MDKKDYYMGKEGKTKSRINPVRELYKDRKLIKKLALNDFKTRYAGSYLGIVWAFIQPVVTVLVYWIVFEKGLKQGTDIVTQGIQVPYLLHLMSGLVPWFFFSEALMNGTTSLLEYNYLVKKVVFKISILPLIKIIAASFIHIFFVCFMLLVTMCYGIHPTVYWLQLIYYSFCLFMLVLAMSYSTCSIVIFFRDLTQLISIGLQVGMWATPILWNISILANHPVLAFIFKLNPVYYIVNGYRGSLYGEEFIWQSPWLTLYYWALVLVLFVAGGIIFKRLKPHFADVL
ncbi:ABC transporter permease [Kineothrix sp. MSJ-39]|uniref:ABC transporter permease n=1 Tax=Kineothrix sp. MSJ-39 TaxID=2841533 RepID=UPI00209E7FFA|nr:ABC transporter permease [Kineothrix sp. MSJ-39]